MTHADMKAAVLAYIRKQRGVSFVELEQLFTDKGYPWEGGLEYYSGACDNVVFWTGWNADAYNILIELKRDGLIHFAPAAPVIYLIDGKGLSCPVVHSNRQYKTPHWLPIVLQPGPEV